MTTIIAFLLALAILVVIHELGHYWVARVCGVKVLRFSVGFGKILFSKRFARGETEWVVCALPLGGYVKMLDEREGEVQAHELHRTFNRQPVLRRMAIAVAGPVANLLLAALLYWVLFMYGVPGLKPIIGEVPPQTPAAHAQLQEQETILSINGQAIQSWEEIRWALLNRVLQGDPVTIQVRTVQGEIISRVLDLKALAPSDLDGKFLQKLGLLPIQPLLQPVIGQLTEGGVAQQAGLRTGDRVMRVEERNIKRWSEFVEAVRSHPGQTLKLDIDRSGSLLTINVIPQASEEAGNGEESRSKVGKIGAAPQINQHEFDALMTQVSYAPFAALQQAVRKTQETVMVSLKMLGKMIVGEVSLKNLSGPITIADYAGQSAQMGLAAYLGFLALVSISLGVLNLLPVPLLDGGHLLYYTVELIKGSPVPEKWWVAGQNVGIALLVTLTVLALFNDISRILG